MTNGLYGYYDNLKQYVVYIGQDADIGIDKRHKQHNSPSLYDAQVINKIVQNHPDRYIYFRFIQGDYDEDTLNDFEREAIRIFKTYKYDYPERNVFNFTRGGDGTGKGQDHPNWRDENYQVIKYGVSGGKQQYAISGRYSKKIKFSTNKKKLEELTQKLLNYKITEEEVESLQLYDIKEHIKKVTQSNIKYNIWDNSYCSYNKRDMLRHNGGGKPRRCFGYKYKGKQIPIGYFNEFTSCEIIDSIVKEEVKKCKHDN